jgi:NAD(P)-dependent dehydrogenase (short-subunit alcohol dehydrogenase family)
MTQHLVVVGGSRGLGKAFAAEAASLGYTVSVLSRTQTGPGHYACDITQPADVARVMAEVHREQGDISNLAFFQRFRGEGDAWEGELQTSLTGTRTVIEASLPLFASAGSRSIVMISSIAAQFVAPDATCGYHVAKAGLCQMARYYADSLGPQGIRVNAVCPGSFIKPESEAHFQSHPEIVRRIAAASPLNRMGTYQDVVNAVLFLLSDKSSFITGQSLLVDGGGSLRRQENST